jgi:hypothetical protein
MMKLELSISSCCEGISGTPEESDQFEQSIDTFLKA